MITFFPQREIALSLAGFDIRWYGLMYLLAFLLTWYFLPRLSQRHQLRLNSDQWLMVLAAGMMGVLLGGRLGYVLLYEPAFYWQQPLKSFAIHEGGMAFHGGIVGVALALWLMSRRYQVSLLALLDVVVIPAALGLFLGRIGNFINQELYGTATTLPWGIMIPGVPLPRHPVQLYAAGKDLLIATLCSWYFFRSPRYVPGRTTALFLISYGVLRFFLGFFREIDGVSLVLGTVTIGEGQLLSLPLIGVGSWLYFSVRGRRSLQPSGYEEGN